MKRLFIRFSPVLFSWLIFILVIFNVQYPQSITQAAFSQLFALFVPLYLSITLTLHLVIKNWVISLLVSLGLLILLILKTLDSLNLVTGALTILAIGFLISYFKKAS